MGWSWATELAALGHEVTVLTRTANQSPIEAEGPHEQRSLQFLYYDLPRRVQRLRRFPGGKMLYYGLWQWFAARHLRRRFPSLPFDVVQHVTYVSARFPSFMGSLGIPFWFGPVSGGEAVPPRLRAGFSAGQRCLEWWRDASSLLVRIDPLMRRTFRQAERIFVTRDTLALLPRSCRHKAVTKLSVGLRDSDFVRSRRPAPQRSENMRLLYVGRLLDWKGMHLALRAVAMARRVEPRISFAMVGEGPARGRLQALSRELQLEDVVHWAGWQPHASVRRYYENSDVLVFPSLRDSGGMAVLEALAHGVPVLCVDLGGPGQVVDATCGRVVCTAGRTADDVVHALAHALIDIISVPGVLESLHHGARVRAGEMCFRGLVESVYAPVCEELMQEA